MIDSSYSDTYVTLSKDLDGIQSNSIGLIEAINGEYAIVYFIGIDEKKRIRFEDLNPIDIFKTGKGYAYKICNICHILKPTKEFDNNQTDAKGQRTTRPSCKECRRHIDGVKLSTAEKKRMDKNAPAKGSVFVCPICDKRSIVGVTANLVRDHNHDTGKGREWICDSCNTGLGRFKDNVEFMEKVIDYLKKFDTK